MMDYHTRIGLKQDEQGRYLIRFDTFDCFGDNFLSLITRLDNTYLYILNLKATARDKVNNKMYTNLIQRLVDFVVINKLNSRITFKGMDKFKEQVMGHVKDEKLCNEIINYLKMFYKENDNGYRLRTWEQENSKIYSKYRQYVMQPEFGHGEEGPVEFLKEEFNRNCLRPFEYRSVSNPYSMTEHNLNTCDIRYIVKVAEETLHFAEKNEDKLESLIGYSINTLKCDIDSNKTKIEILNQLLTNPNLRKKLKYVIDGSYATTIIKIDDSGMPRGLFCAIKRNTIFYDDFLMLEEKDIITILKASPTIMIHDMRYRRD